MRRIASCAHLHSARYEAGGMYLARKGEQTHASVVRQLYHMIVVGVSAVDYPVCVDPLHDVGEALGQPLFALLGLRLVPEVPGAGAE